MAIMKGDVGKEILPLYQAVLGHFWIIMKIDYFQNIDE